MFIYSPTKMLKKRLSVRSMQFKPSFITRFKNTNAMYFVYLNHVDDEYRIQSNLGKTRYLVRRHQKISSL